MEIKKVLQSLVLESTNCTEVINKLQKKVYPKNPERDFAEEMHTDAVITLLDENFPSVYKTVPLTPVVLGVSGDLNLIKDRSRKMFLSGYSFPRNLVEDFIKKENGIIICNLPMKRGSESEYSKALKLIEEVRSLGGRIIVASNEPNFTLEGYDYLIIKENFIGESFRRLGVSLCNIFVLGEKNYKSAKLETNYALMIDCDIYAYPISVSSTAKTGSLNNNLIKEGAELLESYQDLCRGPEVNV